MIKVFTGPLERTITIGRNVTIAPPFSCRKNQCPLATSLRAHLFILKTLLIRRDLRNVLIKHAVGRHKCMHANNSSITNRSFLIVFFLRYYALPVTLTFVVLLWLRDSIIEVYSRPIYFYGSINCLPLWSDYFHVIRYPVTRYICGQTGPSVENNWHVISGILSAKVYAGAGLYVVKFVQNNHI